MRIRDFMTIVERLIDRLTLVEEPALSPAIKDLSNNKIYRGTPGQMHHDVAAEHGFFRVGWKNDPKLMLGFMNHKGHFLDRRRALAYAQNHDMLHSMARRYIGTDGTPAELGASFLKDSLKVQARGRRTP